MKKIFIALVLLMPSLLTTVHADASFEKYIGCYKTIQVNGQPVIDHSGYQQTQIYMGDAFVFADIDHTPIPAIKFFLFKGYSNIDNTINFDFANVFLDRGALTTDSFGDHFTHAGQLWFHLLETIILNAHLRVDASVIGTKLTLHVYRNVPELSHEEVDDTYILEQAKCI